MDLSPQNASHAIEGKQYKNGHYMCRAWEAARPGTRQAAATELRGVEQHDACQVHWQMERPSSQRDEAICRQTGDRHREGIALGNLGRENLANALVLIDERQ